MARTHGFHTRLGGLVPVTALGALLVLHLGCIEEPPGGDDDDDNDAADDDSAGDDDVGDDDSGDDDVGDDDSGDDDIGDDDSGDDDTGDDDTGDDDVGDDDTSDDDTSDDDTSDDDTSDDDTSDDDTGDDDTGDDDTGDDDTGDDDTAMTWTSVLPSLDPAGDHHGNVMDLEDLQYMWDGTILSMRVTSHIPFVDTDVMVDVNLGTDINDFYTLSFDQGSQEMWYWNGGWNSLPLPPSYYYSDDSGSSIVMGVDPRDIGLCTFNTMVRVNIQSKDPSGWDDIAPDNEVFQTIPVTLPARSTSPRCPTPSPAASCWSTSAGMATTTATSRSTSTSTWIWTAPRTTSCRRSTALPATTPGACTGGTRRRAGSSTEPQPPPSRRGPPL